MLSFIWLLQALLVLPGGHAAQLEAVWEVDLYLESGEQFGVLHLPSLAMCEALVQIVDKNHDPLVLEIQGTYYNLQRREAKSRPSLLLIPIPSSAGRGPEGIISPSSAKQELQMLSRFEHGSALALTVTHAGKDPLSQHVPAAVLLGPDGNRAMAAAVEDHEDEDEREGVQRGYALSMHVPKLPVENSTSNRGIGTRENSAVEKRAKTSGWSQDEQIIQKQDDQVQQQEQQQHRRQQQEEEQRQQQRKEEIRLRQQQQQQQEAKPVINILHFNDWHNRMEPTYKPWNSPCDSPGADTSQCSGGVARLKWWLDSTRSWLGKSNTLALNSGDDFIGTVWDQKYKTDQAAHFMNLLRPDVMTVGNHEFDHGVEELANYLDRLNHPALGACNIEIPDWHRLKGKIKEYVSHSIEGTKVCTFGLATDFFSFPERAWPVKVKDAYWSGKNCVQKMRNDGCQVVILLSHVGYTADIAAAELIPGIDVIVGGHSHSLLWGDGKHEGPSLDRDNPSTPSDYVWGSYPTWVSSKVEKKKVPVVQAGWGSRYAGVVRIWMKPGEPGKIESITGWPVLLGGPRSDNPIPEDEFTKEEVKKWRYW